MSNIVKTIKVKNVLHELLDSLSNNKVSGLSCIAQQRISYFLFLAK